MTPGIRRRPALWTGFSLLAVTLVVSSCSGPDTTSADSEPTASAPGGDLPEPMPFETALADAFGADLGAIYRGVLLARREFVFDCMHDAGWHIDQPTLDAMFATDQAPLVDISDQIAYVRSQIKGVPQADLAPMATSGEQSPGQVDQRVKCLLASEEALPNPNDQIMALLGDMDADVGARLRADPAVQRAREAQRECLADRGLVYATNEDPSSVLPNELAKIVADFGEGKTPADQALALIDQLEDQAELAEECITEYRDTETSLVRTYQAAYLRDHPGLVPSIAEQVADSLAVYSSYIDGLLVSGSGTSMNDRPSVPSAPASPTHSATPTIPSGAVICVGAGASEEAIALCVDELGGAPIQAASVSDDSFVMPVDPESLDATAAVGEILRLPVASLDASILPPGLTPHPGATTYLVLGREGGPYTP